MKKYSPTTPGRRQMTGVSYKSLTATGPLKKLLKKIPNHSGRNDRGRITVRHKGGAHKKLYRIVDFGQGKLDIPAKIEALEYDPYRTAFISRILYKDGERRYVLASQNLKVGDEIINSDSAPLKEGNRLKLKNIPVGYFVYNVEFMRGGKGRLARSAGSYTEVLAQENGFTHLKLPSKEVRRINWENFASIGQVSNQEHNLVKVGKAGRSRWLGVRPTVRGSVMNPRDHPYGGGEGRTKRGTRRPKSKWGKIVGGRKTRKKNKQSNRYIVKKRK